MRQSYLEQVRLMLRLLPLVAAEDCFALKGGTAINFFVWDMPRLSVDIDLTYLPIQPRAESLKGISDALLRIETAIGKAFSDFKVHETKTEGIVYKLLVRSPTSDVKIEPNTVMRGSILGAGERRLSAKAQKTFEAAATMRTLADAELFGGKICAALDRQHPRDLFDVKQLLDGPGLSEAVRKSFLVHLISHDRPMHEVIEPNRKDVRAVFETEFREMTDEAVAYESLVEAREALITAIKGGLTKDEKAFLLSLKAGEPDWKLLGLYGVDKLPAVQWKLKNIKAMAAAKREQQLGNLRKKLGL